MTKDKEKYICVHSLQIIKASNQPAMAKQPIRLRYGYKINEAMLLPYKRLRIELGE
jgi:hypothetical protein